MDRQERIDLVYRIADTFGLDRTQFLGGGFAESGINLDRQERWGVWPDVSFGMYHQTVRWAEEGDQSASAENIEFIKNLYFNPEYAATKAAEKFKFYRSREATALDAWCRYNWPAQDPLLNPNRGNYAWGLQKAAEERGEVMPLAVTTWGPDVPDEIVLQQDDWSCSVRSSYAALWAMFRNGNIPLLMDYEQWKNVMVPRYADGNVGLKDASGAGMVAALGSIGITAHNKGLVSLQEVQAKAGTCPVMIGGRNWNHWVYVRGVEEDGTLILENPSPGFKNIRFQLLDSFTRLGTFSMVWIDVKTPEPAPPPPPPAFEFLFGMKAKADELQGGAGSPLENEHPLALAPDRYNVQLTSTGLMVYSKAENSVSFIGG